MLKQTAKNSMATPTIDRILETRGIDEAYEAACRLIREQQAHIDALHASRFFEVRVLKDGTRKLWPTTEAAINRIFNMEDYDYEPPPDFFYCDENGQLHTVILAKHDLTDADGDMPSQRASYDLVANGRVVGHLAPQQPPMQQ